MGAVAGVDRASEHNDLRIRGPSVEQILERRLVGDAAGIARWVALCVEPEVEVVAIQRPEGLLVDRLLEPGLCALPLHPHQVAAARERSLSPARPTASTPTCRPSWRAPTGIASGAWRPTATTRAPWGRSRAPARTWWPPA